MGAQETAQQLRAFSDLVEDQTLVPNTHKKLAIAMSRGLNTLLWSLQAFAHMWCT